MDELISEAAAEPRFRTVVLSIFGALGLLLALVGVYGVTSYSVSQRMHEMGIRAALGAQRADLARLILWDAGLLVGRGAVLGILGALLLTRAAATLLNGVTPVDPLTFAVATLIVCAAGLASAYFPARRASNTDPIVTLRSDV
jgi:putative ABC transport system permease protein